jgi:superfamily II DNA or RNA helicase
LVNKKFKGQTQEVQEHPGYTLISNYSHRNHNKDILFTLLKNRKLLNISSVGMLGTGIDLPWLELAVMPMPTNSHTLYIQRIGRITRLDPGNPRKIAYVLAHPSIPQIQ